MKNKLRVRYLIIPMNLLRAMPLNWQRRFELMLEEIGELYDWRPYMDYRGEEGDKE